MGWDGKGQTSLTVGVWGVLRFESAVGRPEYGLALEEEMAGVATATRGMSTGTGDMASAWSRFVVFFGKGINLIETSGLRIA